MAAPAWANDRSLLIITWDEAQSVSEQIVATILVGRDVVPGSRSAALLSHYSILKTLEESWSLPPLTDKDAGAHPFADLLIH